MFLKIFLKRLSVNRQADFMRCHGIIVGTRWKDGRQTYLYMVSNMFAEILYENDNPKMNVEALIALDRLCRLNQHLEKGREQITIEP